MSRQTQQPDTNGLHYSQENGHERLVRALRARAVMVNASISDMSLSGKIESYQETSAARRAEEVVRLLISGLGELPEDETIALIAGELRSQSITLSPEAIRVLLNNALEHKRMMKHTSDESSGMPF